MLVNVTALWLSSVDGRFVFECRFMQAVYPTSLVGAPSAGCERERPQALVVWFVCADVSCDTGPYC
jgi:hypothetical protein